MESEKYKESVYIADFTEYLNQGGRGEVPSEGVYVGTEDNGIIPSFILTDNNAVPFVVINNEKHPTLFKQKDGTQVSQCECVIYADRNDNNKAWMIFLELKYCKEKNLYNRMLEGISQLKTTCRYLMDERNAFDSQRYKKYLVISTPGITPLDPFDGFYFDKELLLKVKEDTGAIIKATNEANIQTPSVV